MQKKRSQILSKIADIKKQIFITEYLRDMNASRAAVAAGYDSDEGFKLKADKEIDDVVCELIQHEIISSIPNSEWVKHQLVENHKIARQMGNMPASNKALELLGKHADIDAFAAQKVQVQGDDVLIERLNRKIKPSTGEIDFL